MEASSSDATVGMAQIRVPPAIPPRTNIPERRPPNIPDRRSPNITDRRSPNVPDRRSPNIQSQSSSRENSSPHRAPGSVSHNHVRQSSNTSTGSTNAHLNQNQLYCWIHPQRKQTTVCTSCVQLLCDECLLTDRSNHSQCSLIGAGDDDNAICYIVKSALLDKMGKTKGHVSELLDTLSKKKERTIAKRNETVNEVERFYQKLKNKLLTKLQREENELLNYLNQTVAEQARDLSEKINQCSKLTREIGQKEAMVENIDKIHITANNNSERLKSLLTTLVDINKDSRSVEEITATRDAFLVIRFIIDPESEQRMVNTKFAAVEVLDSRANSPCEEANTEIRLIDEAVNTLGATGAESSGSVDYIAPIDDCVEVQQDSIEPSATNTSNNTQSMTPDTNGYIHSSSGSNETTDRHTTRDAAPAIVDDNMTSNENNDESEEEPPPPYPGLPSYVPVEPPPPYPGRSPPPAYVMHPEPQQPQIPVHPVATRPHARSRSEGAPASEDRWLTGRSTPAHVLLPELSDPATSVEPTVTRIRVPFKVFSVNEISDKRSSGIFSMAVFNNNSFLIIDRWNRKLKFFSESGESMGGVLFREEPWDITKVTHEMFAVTVPKLQIIYKIKASSQAVVTVGNIMTLKKYACICYHGTSDMFVCGQVPQFGEPCIDVIGTSGGPILLSFRSDTLGQELFSYPRYVKVSDDGTVIVCDWNLKCLLMFKLDGTVVGRYKGERDFKLNDPTGIEFDKDNKKLFVIDSKQNCSTGAVQKVSLECQCEEVYRVQNDFRDARAVAMYGGQRMAVGNKNGILTIFSTRSRYRQT